MGYRSEGMLWISKEVAIPEDVQKTLDEMDYNEETNIYSFEHWKWYPSFEEVQIVENFLEDLHAELWDFAVLGEDGDVVFEPHNVKFGTYTIIEEL